MKTKKTVKMVLLVFIMTIMFSFSAFASSNALSLEELQQQAQETQAVIDDNSSESSDISYNSSGDSAIGYISDTAKLDKNDPTAQKVGKVMNSWAAKLMQILGYIISIGLGLVTALDVCYIALPPLRGILANGYVGTSDPKANSAGGMGGIGGMNPMGGIGSFGGGGMYGNRMGGMNSIGGMGNSMGAQQNNQPATGRTQWVTNAALNAVTSASSGANPFKVYFKQQAVVCIMAPVIFVLAATGVLSNFGFMLGEVVSQWIGGISL